MEPVPSYWGHDYIHTPSSHTFNPALSGSIIRRFGKLSITTYARMVRLLTNHNFTGAYRAKFRSAADEPTECSCGHFPRGLKTHDRLHVLLECPFYYRGEVTQLDHILDLDPFPKILSFLHLNPGAFTVRDAPPDTSDWDDNDVDPRLELLLNLIGDLAMRHSRVRARLPIRDADTDTDPHSAAVLPAPAAIHAFKRLAHTRNFNAELLPLIELAHEFKQVSRYRRYVKALHTRGHRYPVSNDTFLALRRRLLRTRNGRRSRTLTRRGSPPLPHTDDARTSCRAPLFLHPSRAIDDARTECRALSPPSPTPSISDFSIRSQSPN